MKILRQSIILMLSLITVGILTAQSPYQLNTKKEIAFFGTGLASAGTGIYFRANTPVFTSAELENLNINNINGFDRVATNFFSLKADETSDIFWYGSQVLPFLLLAGEQSRSEFGKIMVLYGEAAILNSGLTLLTKYTVRRARPFNFDLDTSFEKKTSVNAKASFFSGHTSITATNSFFAAKVFSDYYPDSKWKPVVWTVAATIPAITGYLRVRGGRHFPTDVFTGYAIGAAVGYLIPHWHRNKTKLKNVDLAVGINTAYVSLKF